MLYKSLHFKLVLILVLFIISIITVIGAFMLGSVFAFYTNEFLSAMEAPLGEFKAMNTSVDVESDAEISVIAQNLLERLRPEYGNLGISANRMIAILDMNGGYLAGTDDELGAALIKTPNMLKAMNRSDEEMTQSPGASYLDYAVYIKAGLASGSSAAEFIIYIKDTKEEMRSLSWMIFTIIVQSLLIGLVVAVILSFFLASAITAPIQNITNGAKKLSEGDFQKKLNVSSRDEIGTLTETFNLMAENLQNTLEDVSSEREKLQIIFLYLTDGVLVFSSEGKLILINPRGDEIIGDNITSESTLDELLAVLKFTDQYKSMEDSPEAGKVFRDVEYLGRVFDISFGKFRYHSGVSPTADGTASTVGTIVVLHDITQRYALEKSRREFIANVSHELRTPLTSIKTAAETLSLNEVDDDIKTRFFGIIMGESDRMTRIVQDLLVISRLENKKMMWQFADTDIAALAERITDALTVTAKSNNQTIIRNIAPNLPVIRADKERIEQVIVNIISNAMKYTPGGGTIEFTLAQFSMTDFTGVKITVRDNGMGIPKEDLPHIFERFYRVEKARSAEAGGTGLGLSIAKEIVIAHNGQITIDSDLGSGTTVTIVLPESA
ncbi:PAS domain-containing sensor histidine kinase [Clostridia bacterium]|nr:PAS domain-containing sensor histidine kinase [Clostridia bacterium]